MNKDRPTINMPPAEKKRLSYAKDCRNSYGNNDKAARKAMPLRKALENRRQRHKGDAALARISSVDDRVADVLESSVRQNAFRVGGWTKCPDTPLGVGVKNKKEVILSRYNAKAARRLKQAAFYAILKGKGL